MMIPIVGLLLTELLSASIIRFLRDKYARDDAYVLHFFFDYSTVSQNQVDELFRDLIFKIVGKLESVSEEVRTLISAEENFNSKETPPDPRAVFCHLADRLGKHIYIIVDALDECKPDSVEQMYDALCILAHEDHGTRFHVLISSRANLQMRHMTAGERTVDLSQLTLSSHVAELTGKLLSIHDNLDRKITQDR